MALLGLRELVNGESKVKTDDMLPALKPAVKTPARVPAPGTTRAATAVSDAQTVEELAELPVRKTLHMSQPPKFEPATEIT
jgi:hypothetical protein